MWYSWLTLSWTHTNDQSSNGNNRLKYAHSIDNFVCIATLVIFFPAFDTLYTTMALLTILLIQIVIGYVLSSIFIYQWHQEHAVCITEANARRLNFLLLQQGMARCKCRFNLFALMLLAYVHLGDIACTGYVPSPGCPVDEKGDCVGLLYCICASFYYTAAASQLIYISKSMYIDRTAMLLSKCTTVLLLSTSLLYSITTIVDE